MYTLGECCGCGMKLPDDEIDLSMLLFSYHGSMQIYDDLDMWRCPYCDHSFTNIWPIDSPYWYREPVNNVIDLTEIINTSIIDTTAVDAGLNLKRFVCCDTYREESNACNCSISYTFEEADLFRYMNGKSHEEFYIHDQNGMDCRACMNFGTVECDPYCSALHSFTFKYSTNDYVAEPIDLCVNFKANMGKLGQLPSQMLTLDLINMKVQSIKEKSRTNVS